MIRGPDWNHEWEDNGEGFLGTIVEFNVHKRQIRVIWDSGRSGQYRADPGEYDLRMVDNAPTGKSVCFLDKSSQIKQYCLFIKSMINLLTQIV